MSRYEVGQPYNVNLGSIPDGTANWRFTPLGVELLLALSDPSGREIHEVTSGLAQFALLAGDHSLIMAHKFGTMPWSDTPWDGSRQRRAGDEPGLATAGREESLMANIVLVDADTGVIKAMRAVAWNIEFASAVSDAINRQSGAGDAEADAEIRNWYFRYPNTVDLVAACDVRCTGGR
jgi:hypothetical protein